jgi:hypothetical protein
MRTRISAAQVEAIAKWVGDQSDPRTLAELKADLGVAEHDGPQALDDLDDCDLAIGGWCAAHGDQCTGESA